MSTEQILRISSINSETTESIAEKLGKHLKGGEVIELVSDLGGGKTTFVKGLVRGSGSTDHVSSPTFTISNIYMTKKLEIHHFDFYRLYEAGLIEHEIVDLINDPKVVIIVEWSDVVKHVLPSERIMVHIKNEGQEKRQLEIKYPDKLAYVMEAFT